MGACGGFRLKPLRGGYRHARHGLSAPGPLHNPDRQADAADAGASGPPGDCVGCALRGYSICATLNQGQTDGRPRVRKTENTARPRQLLYRNKDRLREVFLIREGVAIRYAVVSGGRRQILSFGLPGDFLSTSMVTKGAMNFSIKALTAMRLCVFDKDEFDAFVRDEPDAWPVFARACMAEKEDLEARVVDLGRRTAEERIARFMLDLATRAVARGGCLEAIPFPMKQQHIADALGLTQVHVSRIIGRLRKARLIDLSGGTLRILSLEGLRDAAADRPD